MAATVMGGLAASGLVFLVIKVFSTDWRVIEPLGWEGDSGWVDPKVVLKVTFFFTLFSFIVINASMRVLGASLGTLNSSIPSQSEAAYDMKIWGFVSSLKM